MDLDLGFYPQQRKFGNIILEVQKISFKNFPATAASCIYHKFSKNLAFLIIWHLLHHYKMISLKKLPNQIRWLSSSYELISSFYVKGKSRSEVSVT